MKVLTVSEASNDLSTWVQLALEGEEISIRAGNEIVELRPAQQLPGKEGHTQLSPRKALRLLQRDARLSAAQAESYLREVREERIAADDRRPA